MAAAVRDLEPVSREENVMKGFIALTVAAGIVGLTAAPAFAQCPPFLCYFDSRPGLSSNFICPSQSVYPRPVSGIRQDQVQQVVATPFNPSCDVNDWMAAVVQVDLPPECSGIEVWVDYQGTPEGWTVNIGDSKTNNGFGGDSGSTPIGQNAEVQVLDESLAVYSAADNPVDVDRLVLQHLALTDGALKFTVGDQSLSWGQPFAALETEGLERLFFVPATGDRTLYVGLNRVVDPAAPLGTPNTTRNGCGLRHAIIFTR